jgi:nucleotide-binding universal stress UspA family protein
MTFSADKILCPVDFSDPSREAMHVAAELARKLDGSLTLLHVVSLPSVGFPEMAFGLPTGEVASQVEVMLDEWRKDARSLGVHVVHTQTSVGTPYQEIVRIAREQSYGLIVIGTHGRTGLDHLLVGSVAEKIVRRAPCPVLTVRPQAARDSA